MAKYNATFVGTGFIGAGLAANAALRDFEVTMYDIVETEKMKANISHVFNLLTDAGATDRGTADAALSRIHFSNDLQEAVRNADFVQECIPERLQLKQDTYRTIQQVTGPDTVISSSTSSIFPSKLQEGALYPESILVGHPYNPSYLIPLIEIVGGEGASQNAIDKALAIYKEMGKVPIVCRKEVEGFLVNRISWAATNLSKEAVREGICSAEDIDKALMFGPGMRMAVTGQMLTISLGVEGGFRNEMKKYGGQPTEYDELYAQSVEAEIAAREPWQGNTVEDVCRFRDRMFVELLKLHKLM